MANRKRPYLWSGAALASAAAIVAASPAIVPSQDLVSGSAKSVTANYELMALSDITIAGISNAYWNGWGNYVGACCTTDGDPFDPTVLYPANADGSPPFVSDPYYPEINGPRPYYPAGASQPSGYYYDQNPVYLTGVAGIIYYVVDSTLYGLATDDLYNYFFEIGWYGGGTPNALYSQWSALAYVGASKLFGQDSAIAQMANTIFHIGVTPTIQSAVVSLSTVLVPAVDIGPVKVGAGNLAGLYFFGSTPTGTYQYGIPGLAAVWGYIATSIAGDLPEAGAVPAAAALVAASDTLTSESETPESAAPESVTPESVAALTSDSATTKAAVGGSKAESAVAVAVADAAGAEDVAPSTEAPAGLQDAAEASESGASESTDATGSGGGHAAGAKPGKPRAENPAGNAFSKITSKVRAALGGGKKSAGSDSDSASSAKADSDSGSSNDDS